MSIFNRFKKTVSRMNRTLGKAKENNPEAFENIPKFQIPQNPARNNNAVTSPAPPTVAVDRTPTGLIGDSANDMSADKLNADIMRRKWDQFEQSDMPYIMKYADRVVGGQDTVDAVNQARGGVNRGFDIAEQTQQRSDASLGLGLSNAQQADRKADVKRSHTAALVDAENSAWTAGKDRENALLAGSHMPKAQGN